MPAPPVAADSRYERIGKSTAPGVYVGRLAYTEALPGYPSYEWNELDCLRNLSRMVDRTENCARYIQLRQHDDGSGWALCIEACDESFGAKYGPTVPNEIGLWTNGPDPYKWRLPLHITIGDARRVRTGEIRNEFVEVAQGLLLSHNGHTNARFGVGIKVKHFWDAAIAIDGEEEPGKESAHHIFKFKGRFVTGFSFAGAEFSGSPIRLARGQTIGLEGTDSVTLGLHGTRVEFRLNGQLFFAVDYNTGDRWVKGVEHRIP